MSHKKIVIAGGGGYLGKAVANRFRQNEYEVVILSRNPASYSSKIRGVVWDGASVGEWAKELEEAELVINLAGRTVNCRYNEKNKQEIYDSRLKSTEAIGVAISRCLNPPKVWINSSSATIYRYAEDRPMDENTGEIGSGFSVDVCQKWEQTLNEAVTPNTRKVALRLAMVFGEGTGGVMEAYLNIVKLGLGGTMGSGKQYVSWVHLEDFLRTLEWIVAHAELSGAINCAAPNPLPNREFMATLRKSANQPIGLPATKWMLEIGAFALGTETELLLKSRRVVPTRLLDTGFIFKYPKALEAFQEILAQGGTSR